MDKGNLDMLNFDPREWFEIMLSGETFVQTMQVGDVFLGSFYHSPYVRGTWQDKAWQHGFFSALPGSVVTKFETGEFVRFE